jgi:hypothetical protein
MVVYLGAGAAFHEGSHIPERPWQSVGLLAGVTVTALLSAWVVRRRRVGPPWRTLLVLASLLALPAFGLIYVFAVLLPAFGISLVSSALLVGGTLALRRREVATRRPGRL